MVEMSKLRILRERWANSRGPCGFCGIPLEKGAQIYAIYDAITGMLLFLVALVILVLGDFRTDNGNHYYPTEKANMPRPLVVFFIAIGFYCGSCALILFYAAGSRNIYGCFTWIILNLPLNFVSPVKIYGTLIVYKLAKEIREEESEREFDFDQVQVDLGPGQNSGIVRRHVMKSKDAAE